MACHVGEFAVDDGVAEAVSRVVVGWFDAKGVGERPECGPAAEEFLGKPPLVFHPWAFAGRVLRWVRPGSDTRFGG